jgi:hypothetical protein
MTEEQNRSTDNLLILCLEHALEIDQPNRVSAFPVELLKSWKQEQLNEFDALGGQGWMLTSEMAEDALRASEKGTSIINSVLNLGGTGGSAPGAGGGGGGAFGINATGGPGGPGGDTRREGVPLINDFLDSKHPSGESPGSGGGGAGAEGENAVGGGGGGGGERVVGAFSIEDLDSAGGPLSMQVVIGQGGSSGQHLGEHAESGDDTELRFVTADGKVVRSIVAKGGARGLPGFAVPPGAREVTFTDIDSGLNVSALMVADVFHTKGGLLYVMGGAAECWLCPTLPTEMYWPATVVVSLGRIPDSLLLTFYAVVDNPLGHEVFRLPFNVQKGVERPVANFIQFLDVRFKAKIEGVWVLRVLSGDYEFARLPLGIKIHEA